VRSGTSRKNDSALQSEEELARNSREITRLTRERDGELADGNRLTDLAGADLLAATSSNPEHEESHAFMGDINLTRASILEEIRLLTADETEAMRLDEQIRTNLLNAARHYSRALELDPDNEHYRDNLEMIEQVLRG
jgi:hypothetical protein